MTGRFLAQSTDKLTSASVSRSQPSSCYLSIYLSIYLYLSTYSYTSMGNLRCEKDPKKSQALSTGHVARWAKTVQHTCAMRMHANAEVQTILKTSVLQSNLLVVNHCTCQAPLSELHSKNSLKNLKEPTKRDAVFFGCLHWLA